VEPALLHVTMERHLVEQRVVVVVRVPRGPRRPYRTNKGVYYVRGPAGRRIATREELLQIYQSAQALFPDELAVEEADQTALDYDYLVRIRPEFRALGPGELTRTLVNLKLMADAQHPTLAGLVCYGSAPQHFRPYARITAIRLRGTEMSEEFLDREEIAGNIAHQVRRVQGFVRRQFAGIPDSGPAPIYPPPVEALDEAIVNVVAHRDYLALAQIHLFVFDDRVEVIAPGRLLNSVTVEQMRDGCHVVRNPRIFAHLARLRLATDAGLGIPNMIRSVRAKGLPDPEIVPTANDLCVIFRVG
jgi:ATP-dependent DNA helicase RecG